jgi:hypothetical protein
LHLATPSRLGAAPGEVGWRRRTSLEGAMAAGTGRGRPIAAVLIAAMVAAVAGAVLLAFQPAGARGLAAVLFVAGLAGGVVLAGRLPAPRQGPTLMERLNDIAFAVVVTFVSVLVGLAWRPWLAVVPGLVCGVVAARATRAPALGGPPDGSGPTGRAEAP